MRPESIRKFDLFYLGALAVSIASTLMNFEKLVLGASQQEALSAIDPSSFILITRGFSIGIGLLLWFLASRLRFGFARWLILAYFILQAIALPSTLAAGVSSVSITGLISLLLQGIAVFFLFRPDAREWFAAAGK